MCDVLPVKLTTKTNVDYKTECLLFGYIREIGINKKIIPSTILHLCIIFYSSKLTIVCIRKPECGYPIIDICLYDQQKYCATTILPLDESTNPLTVINNNAYAFGFDAKRNCYVNDFEIPPYILKLNKQLDNTNNKYAAIFTMGNYRKCRGYIVDINNSVKYKIHNVEHIEIFDWNLSKLSLYDQRRDRYPDRGYYDQSTGSLPVYSPKHGLVIIGGSRSVDVIKFYPACKWENIASFKDLRFRRYGTAAMISDDKLIYCGGKYTNKVDVLDLSSRQWDVLSDMRRETGRSQMGMYVDNKTNQRVYVGGGKIPPLTGGMDMTYNKPIKVRDFGYLDLIKDKWVSLCDTNYAHGVDPIMWMDVGSIIYIASTDVQMFERMDVRENKWNIEIEAKEFNALFGKVTKRKLGHRLFM